VGTTVVVGVWLMFAQAAAGARTSNACALLSAGDVQKIVGAAIVESRPSAAESRGLLLDQCYLSTGSPRSISIAVAAPVAKRGGSISPRQFWRDRFHARSAGEGETAESGETGARPVRGVGDEAFWSGTPVAGALYVLRGDTFVRVSVGGIADERQRIERSREVAAAILPRLPKR
jgi:hypothetical protein